MEQWDKIIKTALIGTDKMPLVLSDFEEDISSAISVIANNTSADKEMQYLQIAALVYNYRQAGARPLHQEIEVIPADEETMLYCSDFAKAVLQGLLIEESYSLLKMWLLKCEASKQIVSPELLPRLFDIAIQQKQLRQLVVTCGGNRGKWLTTFNKAWVFTESTSDEELWQTGTLEQRKKVLDKLRAIDATAARVWLQQTWQQESAATKQVLLTVLSTNLSADDVMWLEQVAGDKSQKVKEEALRLLKLIPESTIIQKYWGVLSASVLLKKEKALLGLTTKLVLAFQLVSNIDETVFKLGIEKLSPHKNISDEQYILQQLIAQVPPQFWETHLALSPKEIIDLFSKSTDGKALLDALALAVGKFKNEAWARYFLERKDTLYFDLIPLLTPELKEQYTLQYFDNEPTKFVQYFIHQQEEWSLPVTKKIFSFMANNPYQYNRSFYQQHIPLIPLAAISLLDSCTPKEEYAKNYWATLSGYIDKLLAIKQQIHQWR